jgi:hypothetical protein
MPAYRKADPVDAIQIPWAFEIRLPDKRPKLFPAGSWLVRNRTNGKTYILPDSEFRALYVPDDDLAAGAFNAAPAA